MSYAEIVHWVDVAYAVAVVGYWLFYAIGHFAVPDIPETAALEHLIPPANGKYHTGLPAPQSADEMVLQAIAAPPRAVGRVVGGAIYRWQMKGIW